MFLVAVALLQATAPAQSAASVEPVAVAEASVPAEIGVAEPKMKRVCRKVMDPRVNTLAGRETVCKYVPVEDKASNR